ncbi:MAG: hypothetical protein GVY36_20045 [Verrucomicrobia bacterium]|jgi:prolyl-tRNA editing enzyme YbaK/EbsC (Cys-tRNA(Pro) deacylase)|nr:hypothetical protein [Verrucomicrobiota bacterium]
MEKSSVYNSAIAILKCAEIEYEVFEHRPIQNMADAIEVTGGYERENLKSLLIASGENHGIFVLPGDQRLEFSVVRSIEGLAKGKLADRRLVFEVLGCEPGSVSPIGNPKNIPVFLEESVLGFQFLFINPGDASTTLKLSLKSFFDVLSKHYDLRIFTNVA